MKELRGRIKDDSDILCSNEYCGIPAEPPSEYCHWCRSIKIIDRFMSALLATLTAIAIMLGVALMTLLFVYML